MQRDIRHIADNPAVVRLGWDVKKRARREIVNRTIEHRRCRVSGKNKPDVFHVAVRYADRRTHMR